MPIGGKPADGVYWSDFHQLTEFESTHFYWFARASKIYADIACELIQEDLVDTKLVFGFRQCKTQPDNSLITIKIRKRMRN
jgi:hypothetical protein